MSVIPLPEFEIRHTGNPSGNEDHISSCESVFQAIIFGEVSGNFLWILRSETPQTKLSALTAIDEM